MLPEPVRKRLERLDATIKKLEEIKLSPLKEFVRLRNIIAHEYLSINYQKIYERLQNINIFKKYAQAVLRFLEESKS